MPKSTIKLSDAEISKRGKSLYASIIKPIVENLDNIGKMVIIDIEKGDFEVDDLGLNASRKLHARRRAVWNSHWLQSCGSPGRCFKEDRIMAQVRVIAIQALIELEPATCHVARFRFDPIA